MKLIVIDSVAFHFRQDFYDMAQRTRLLAEMAQKLMHLAEEKNLAVSASVQSAWCGIRLAACFSSYTQAFTLTIGDMCFPVQHEHRKSECLTCIIWHSSLRRVCAPSAGGADESGHHQNF